MIIARTGLKLGAAAKIIRPAVARVAITTIGSRLRTFRPFRSKLTKKGINDKTTARKDNNAVCSIWKYASNNRVRGKNNKEKIAGRCLRSELR